MNRASIAACPFCGSNDLDLQQVDVKTWAVSCAACKAVGPTHIGQDQTTAIARWSADRSPIISFAEQEKR